MIYKKKNFRQKYQFYRTDFTSKQLSSKMPIVAISSVAKEEKMVLRMIVCLIVCLISMSGLVFANEPVSSYAKKAKKSYEEEKDKLKKGYENAIKRYDEILEKELSRAKKEYVDKLEFARKNALIKNDLNEAQRIVAVKESVSKESVQQEKSKQTCFVGTEWRFGNNRISFLKDNRFGYDSGKGKPSYKGSWISIDDNTILISGIGANGGEIWVWKAVDLKNSKILIFDPRGNPTHCVREK